MNLELSPEARQYGLVAQRAIESAGGDELAQAAENEPAKRAALIEVVLDEIGAWQLDPRSGPDELEAAAALAHSAGYWALPYPVAERLARPADGDGLIVIGRSQQSPLRPRAAAAIAGIDLRWVAVDLDGNRSRAVPRPLEVPPRKSAFVTDLDLEPLDTEGAADVALGLVLPCWTLLGMLDRALEMTIGYVRERQQFGQPLAAFQSVQFQLTDVEVERIGLEELAKYALWSIEVGRADALVDALALRAAAVEAADVTFRITHQLHGAIGFCDETVLSWVSRYSQPIRRLPLGLSATRAELARRLGRNGLAGLFDGTDACRRPVSYDLPPELTVESDGPVRTVVINRPDQLGAVNPALHNAMAQVWRQLSADREAKVVVVTGTGRAFSAGGDLDWISSFVDDPVGRYESIREGAEIIEEMLRFPLPVIAAVNGPALGLGLSIALLSDIVLISEDAYLADPHVSVGLVAGDGGAAFWPLLTPIMRSREFLFTGERIPAAKAVELGLASRAVPGDQLRAEADKLARKLARQPVAALQGTKRVVNMYLSQALAGPVPAGFALEEATMQSDDHRQRLAALRPGDGAER